MTRAYRDRLRTERCRDGNPQNARGSGGNSRLRNDSTNAVFCSGASAANEVHATHIVGGEIGYRCLGNDMYEIRLRVFRDCDTGVPWFDNPASVGVFDSNDSLIFDLRVEEKGFLFSSFIAPI